MNDPLRRAVAAEVRAEAAEEQVERKLAGDERLAGVIAVVIALTTLIAALAGYLQADASNQASDRRTARSKRT